MIRIALECVLLFLLPAALYFGYAVLMADTAIGDKEQAKRWAQHLDDAPLGWLFVAGVVFVFGALITFATLQDSNIDKPYVPAIFKDGKIQKGDGQ